MNFFVLIQRFCDPLLLFHVIFPAIFFLLYEVFVMNHVFIFLKKIFSTSLAQGIKPLVPALAGGFFTTEQLGSSPSTPNPTSP